MMARETRLAMLAIVAWTLLIVTLAQCMASPAHATDIPRPDCETVRTYVRQHGIVIAYARALAAGYSPRQIREVRRRCGV